MNIALEEIFLSCMSEASISAQTKHDEENEWTLHLLNVRFLFLGFAFNDSPVGLAAYLLEKISTATNIANKDKPGEVHVMYII